MLLKPSTVYVVDVVEPTTYSLLFTNLTISSDVAPSLAVQLIVMLDVVAVVCLKSLTSAGTDAT